MNQRTPHPTILLTGANGQIGWELQRTLAPLGSVAAPVRTELDLADPERIRSCVRALRPALVVNAGAYTAVDAAEAEPDLARAVNAVAPGVLAEEAARLGAPLVHFSTDYVFSGAKHSPYVEGDEAGPRNVYGETKLAGERAVADAGAAHLTFRTSWVYGTRGKNFLRTVLRLAREREELRVVNDQTGAPTWSRMVAEAVAQIVARYASGGGFALPEPTWGVYHLSAAGETTWWEFARTILALDPAREEQRCRTVVAIPSSEFPTPASRPAYSVLDSGRTERVFGVRLPHWREQLTLAVGEIAAPLK